MTAKLTVRESGTAMSHGSGLVGIWQVDANLHSEFTSRSDTPKDTATTVDRQNVWSTQQSSWAVSHSQGDGGFKLLLLIHFTIK